MGTLTKCPLTFYSLAAGRTPLIANDQIDAYTTIWFNGKAELLLPETYYITDLGSNAEKTRHGDRGWFDIFYLSKASKDGTRFLVQGNTKTPILIDISRAVGSSAQDPVELRFPAGSEQRVDLLDLLDYDDKGSEKEMERGEGGQEDSGRIGGEKQKEKQEKEMYYSIFYFLF